MANAQKSRIIQTNDIRDAIPHVCPRTLCVTDLDDSALKLAQHLGSHRWYDRYFLELQKKHNDPKKALDELINIGIAVHAKSAVHPVEKHTREVMHHMTTMSLGLLGLTARGYCMEAITRRQLDSINIHPNLGIIFAEGEPKGPLLSQYVTDLEVLPLRVLFIEDQLNNAHCVRDAMTALGIEVVVLHYTHALQTEFCFESSQVQLEIFLSEGRLISDEEAKAMLAQRES